MNHFPPSLEQKAADSQASQQNVPREGQSNAEKSVSASETTHVSSSGSKAASQLGQEPDESFPGRPQASERSLGSQSDLPIAQPASNAAAKKSDLPATKPSPKLVDAAAPSRAMDHETEELSLSKVYDSEGNTDSSIEFCALPKAIPDSVNASPYQRKSEAFPSHGPSQALKSPEPVGAAPLQQQQPSILSDATEDRSSRKRRRSESTDMRRSTEAENTTAARTKRSQSKPLKRRRTSNFVAPPMPPLAKGNNFLDPKKLKQLLNSDR